MGAAGLGNRVGAAGLGESGGAAGLGNRVGAAGLGNRVDAATLRIQYLKEGRQADRQAVFYLTTHSTHFSYGYMASDIW